MNNKIREALNKLAEKKKAKIEKKYNGDSERYIAKVWDATLKTAMGKYWEKNNHKRMYFNEYNTYYDYSTGEFKEIYSGEHVKEWENFKAFEELEQYLIAIILEG